MKTLLILISLTIFSASGSLAILPGAPDQTSETDQTEPIKIYLIEGKTTKGRLTEIIPPALYRPPVPDHRFQIFPVILDPYLPYPNPYSHPIIVITVGRDANFTIDVHDPLSNWMDKFEFVNIEEGLYLFTLYQPVQVGDFLFVTLRHDGLIIGKTHIANTVLNRLK